MEEGFKPCPFCAEPIRQAAVVCRFCGRSLPSEPGIANASSPDNTRRHVGITILTVMLIMLGAAIFQGQYAKSKMQSPAATQAALRESEQPSAPQPVLVPVPMSFPIVNGPIEVAPQQIRYFRFTIPQVAQNAGVRGSFHAFGGSGNDIQAGIMTPFEFENWRNGHQARVYYDSRQVTNGDIEVSGLEPGAYILAFSNRSSVFSRKEITGDITLNYTVMQRQ